MVRALALALGLTLGASPAAAAPAAAACDQAPGQRFFWIEPAFCDLTVHGPAAARGLVIWTHGISGTLETYRAPAPPALRLLQTRGWDVVVLKRHNLAETDAERSLYKAVERTLEEVRAQRKRGYRRIVLGGQSFGGHVALDAAERSTDVFAVVAMAPGFRLSSPASRLDVGATERQLAGTKATRVALVLPRDDEIFGNVTRGRGADAALRARGAAYLLVDETSDVHGHEGGSGGRFALQYGPCLADFLSDDTVAPGRFNCPAVRNEWSVVRELALPAAEPLRLADPGRLPSGLGRLRGWWYGVMGDTVVVFALLDGPGLRVAYRWVASRVGGGVYAAELHDGRIRVATSRTAIAVGDDAGAVTLTWTSVKGERTRSVALQRGE